VFLLRSIVDLHLALCQTVCKPGSVPPKSGDGHSSGTFVAERLARPTRAAARKARPAARLSPHRLPLLLGLAPGGVYPAAAVAGGAVRSYRTISPLPPAGPRGDRMGSAVCFLWHFPWGRPRRALPGTVPPWSPDFPPSAQVGNWGGERPSDRLAWEDLGCRAPSFKSALPPSRRCALPAR
jgi:hypothetical protein